MKRPPRVKHNLSPNVGGKVSVSTLPDSCHVVRARTPNVRVVSSVIFVSGL